MNALNQQLHQQAETLQQEFNVSKYNFIFIDELDCSIKKSRRIKINSTVTFYVSYCLCFQDNTGFVINPPEKDESESGNKLMAQILVVDDSSTLKNEVTDFLSSNDMDVISAVDGQDGL